MGGVDCLTRSRRMWPVYKFFNNISVKEIMSQNRTGSFTDLAAKKSSTLWLAVAGLV
jgi:hypothetical protein